MVAHGFGTISLDGYADGRFPFLSSTFQDLMLEIWKVKYLQMPRFGEVIRSHGRAPARSFPRRWRFTGHPDSRLRQSAQSHSRAGAGATEEVSRVLVLSALFVPQRDDRIDARRTQRRKIRRQQRRRDQDQRDGRKRHDVGGADAEQQAGHHARQRRGAEQADRRCRRPSAPCPGAAPSRRMPLRSAPSAMRTPMSCAPCVTRCDITP